MADPQNDRCSTTNCGHERWKHIIHPRHRMGCSVMQPGGMVRCFCIQFSEPKPSEDRLFEVITHAITRPSQEALWAALGDDSIDPIVDLLRDELDVEIYRSQVGRVLDLIKQRAWDHGSG